MRVNGPTSRGTGVCVSHPPKADAGVASSSEKKSIVHKYLVGFSNNKVIRDIRKDSFLIKPWKFHDCAGNENLKPAVQAAFQAARPYLEVLRIKRITATRMLCNGRKDWRKIYYNLVEDFNKDSYNELPALQVIYKRYHRFCVSEIRNCYKQLRLNFGISDTDLATCPTGKRYRSHALLRPGSKRHS
jgi:hypothetical protein